MKRQTFGISQIISSDQRADDDRAPRSDARTRATARVPTASSSPNDAAQFENGSGDVLISARLPVFARWLPAASEPPTIAAASAAAADASPNTLAASAAPAGMRMNVCTTSHSVSTPGILSAKNSTKNMKPDAASTHGCASTARPPGSSTTSRYAEPADDEQHRVEPDAARPAERRRQRDELPRVERGRPGSVLI